VVSVACDRRHDGGNPACETNSWSEIMMQSLILAATAVALAAATVAIPTSADARAHHRIHRNFEVYAFAPWSAPGYRYAAPFRTFDRLGSNLNPDRQMVGIGD
jgi:ABC-type Fe3+ transport system permease subunit